VLPRRELARVLKRVRLVPVHGPFHRFADLSFVHRRLAARRATEVLRGLGAKMNGGRFTPRDAFETLYVATTAETARIEAESRLTAAGTISVPTKPYVHFVVSGRLQRVLDLTNDSVLRALQTTADEIFAPWVIKQAQGREAMTQLLGRMVHAAATIEAILFASSKDRPDGRCLAILPDRLRRGSALEIVDDTGLVREHIP
jgi:RES domain-containing protein